MPLTEGSNNQPASNLSAEEKARLAKAVEFGKANIRRVASTDVDAIRETVQLHASAIDGLWKRIEFVREETLFELRAAIKSAPTAELAVRALLA